MTIAIVEERPEQVERLQRLLSCGGWEISGLFASASELVAHMPKLKAKLILLHWLAGCEEYLRVLTAHYGKPVVVVCEDSPDEVEPEALRLGAVSVVRWPQDKDDDAFLMHLDCMSRVPVIKRPLRRRPAGFTYEVVGIAASTGGPVATVEILRTLRPECGAPVLVVQHITAEFADGYAEWLQTNCPWTVRLGEHGMATEAGVVYLAPPERHMTWDGQRVRLDDGPPRHWQRPSGTVLLDSIARAAGARAIGVVLSGIGEDGADGLFEIRKAGGYTIAQDRESATVFGMPSAAINRGAAMEQLPPLRIGLRLKQLLERPQGTSKN